MTNVSITKKLYNIHDSTSQPSDQRIYSHIGAKRNPHESASILPQVVALLPGFLSKIPFSGG